LNENVKICTVKPARLVLLHEIGRGGSSIVYLVQDRVSGERYAMKVLKQNMCEEVAITEMDIRKEAAILETLGKEQTGIPAFYGMLGETARSGFLKEVSGGEAASTGFLMEYIEGESLQKIL
jgi:serine/threonine protein kinase